MRKINHNEIKKILKVNKFDVIPIVDKKEKVKDVLSWDQYLKLILETRNYLTQML